MLSRCGSQKGRFLSLGSQVKDLTSKGFVEIEARKSKKWELGIHKPSKLPECAQVREEPVSRGQSQGNVVVH